MVEHLTRNEKVVGSIPTISSRKNAGIVFPAFFLYTLFACGVRRRTAPGGRKEN